MANEEANSGTATGGYYDVFLSFRGPDTRNTFADILNVFLKIKGIRSFLDDEELRPGEKILEILRAVKNSQICIPIFSKNYASSRWCLRELKCMVESHGQSPGKQILPIFYDVDPSDVKLETELYESALRKHEEELGCDEVNRWREALTTVARIKGWHIKDQRQGEVIEKIAEEVFRNITTRKRYLPDNLVGIDDRVEDIMRLLNCCDTSGVRVVIIHGIGGMGKTTLANAVFNKLSPQFEGHSFLADIQGRDIGKIQRKLVMDLSHHLLPETSDFEEGNNKIRKILPNKRVLIVFDGMYKNDQFMQLAKHSALCSPGSRIIITTTDKRVFSEIKEEGFEENISTRSIEIIPYEMKEMDMDHALQLFKKCAFKTDSAQPDLCDLSKEVVKVTGGLPLAVEVIGSHLRCQSKEQWISTLNMLKEVPHEEVINRFKISYNALNSRAKEIFRDIACFFVNKRKASLMYMWEACGYHPEVTINSLIKRSLIKIGDDDKIWMHNQLRNVGREIVRETVDQSRSWCLEMGKNKTKNTVALTPRRMGHNFTCKDFVKLKNAKFLELDGGNLAGDFDDSLPELRFLCWRNCPPEPQPNNLVLDKLVILKLTGEITAQGWSQWLEIMVPSKLKVLHLSGSKSLIKTPCFSELVSLERLTLKDLQWLVEIDPSIGKLRRLIYIKIKRCPRLQGLPTEIGCLSALKELILIWGCSVCHLPDSIGNLKLLSRLIVEDTELFELPDTIRGLVGLEYLSLANCKNLNLLPDGIGELKSLTELDLSGTTIKELPHSIWKLKDLTLRTSSSRIGSLLVRLLPLLEDMDSILSRGRTLEPDGLIMSEDQEVYPWRLPPLRLRDYPLWRYQITRELERRA